MLSRSCDRLTAVTCHVPIGQTLIDGRLDVRPTSSWKGPPGYKAHAVSGLWSIEPRSQLRRARARSAPACSIDSCCWADMSYRLVVAACACCTLGRERSATPVCRHDFRGAAKRIAPTIKVSYLDLDPTRWNFPVQAVRLWLAASVQELRRRHLFVLVLAAVTGCQQSSSSAMVPFFV